MPKTILVCSEKGGCGKSTVRGLLRAALGLASAWVVLAVALHAMSGSVEPNLDSEGR